MVPVRPVVLALTLAPALLVGCASSELPAPVSPSTEAPDEASASASAAPSRGTVDVVAGAVGTGGKTAGAAAILAGKVALEGTKTAGTTVGAFFTSGSDAAAAAWSRGARRTRVVARDQARYTRDTASEPEDEPLTSDAP
jgi:hypothetical protein